MPSPCLPDTGTFLSRYWQKKPLLIRQAFPGFKPLLSPEELLALAGEDEVESRLIQSSAGRWKMAHGPFDTPALPSLKKKHWSLLVQGVDLHLDSAEQLLQHFRFIPDARLDDLMISLAGDQGGVGPHFDSYDVFLLQAWGQRQWHIGPLQNKQLKPDCPVKLLADFQPSESFLLNPGDMLYLPPDYGHDGVAQGPCMTYSIGFRSPTRAEFLQAFFNDCSDRVEDDSASLTELYSDAGMSPQTHPAEIPSGLSRRLGQWAKQARPDQRALESFIGRFLSEPKANVWFDRPQRLLGASTFKARACTKGVRLVRANRLLLKASDAQSGFVYWNGQEQFFEGKNWHLASEFAKSRSIVVQQQLFDGGIGAFLYEGYRNGWLALL